MCMLSVHPTNQQQQLRLFGFEPRVGRVSINNQLDLQGRIDWIAHRIDYELHRFISRLSRSFKNQLVVNLQQNVPTKLAESLVVMQEKHRLHDNVGSTTLEWSVDGRSLGVCSHSRTVRVRVSACGVRSNREVPCASH